MLADSEIALQQSEGECAHAAITNLLRLRGRNAPSSADLEKRFQTCRQGSTQRANEVGARINEIAAVLGSLGLLCGIVLLPSEYWHKPERLLSKFIAEGYNLLLFFNWKDSDSKEIITHITLIEGYNAEGYQCIDSDGLPPGSRFELEPHWSEAEFTRLVEYRGKTTNGSRVLLPYSPVCIYPNRTVGLLPLVVVVWPS